MNIRHKQTERELEIINGLLLGDGGIAINKNSSLLAFNTSSEQHANYIFNLLNDYGIWVNENRYGPKRSQRLDKRTNKTYTSYTLRSSCNICWSELYKKWYPLGTKIIPSDLKLTPLTCLIWYLGDGGLAKNSKNGQTSNIKISTNAFKENEIREIIFSQFNIFEPNITYTNKTPNIYIPRRKINGFLNYIGECPFNEYSHKWNVKEYKYLSVKESGIISHIEKKESVLDMYTSGISICEISKNLNIAKSLVRKYLVDNNIYVLGRDRRIYKIQSPEGIRYETNNLEKFCKDHSLSYGALNRLANKHSSSYRQWKIS